MKVLRRRIDKTRQSAAELAETSGQTSHFYIPLVDRLTEPRDALKVLDFLRAASRPAAMRDIANATGIGPIRLIPLLNSLINSGAVRREREEGRSRYEVAKTKAEGE